VADLAADGYNIPNAYGLKPADFEHDQESYSAALAFLGDVSCGEPEDRALLNNGGSPEMLRAWESSARFRRALAKCRKLGAEEREHDRRRAADDWPAPPRWGQRRFDPFARRFSAWREQAGALDWLSWLKREAGQPVDGPVAPGESRFVPISDLTDAQLREIRLQQRSQQEPAQPAPAPRQDGATTDGGVWVGADGVPTNL
jgi:hypothetical protein